MRRCKLNGMSVKLLTSLVISFLCVSLLSAQSSSQKTETQSGLVSAPRIEPVKPVEPVAPVTVDMSRPMGPKSFTRPRSPQSQQPSQAKQNINNQSQTNGAQYTPGAKYADKDNSSQKKSLTTTASSAEQKQTIAEAGQDILNRLSSVSAMDLTSLAGQGLVPDVSSLLGGTLLNGQTGQTNDKLLTQILNELNEIKANQKTIMQTDVSKLKPANEPPAIRRFVINSHDILKSCNTVYFSNVEADGSFLLTGDCKSIYGNAVLEETFYMLFKSCGTKEGRCVYSVEFSVSQKRENQNSLLYKLSTQENISAQRIGNLITVRKNEQTFKTDMLIDIGR